METKTEICGTQYADRYASELDKKTFMPSAKLEKAKAYFREHGVPDFDKILKEAEEKESR